MAAGRHEYLAYAVSMSAMAGNNEAEDDERDEEAEQLAEDGIESGEEPSEPFGDHVSATDAESDGYDYLQEKVDLQFSFHGLKTGCGMDLLCSQSAKSTETPSISRRGLTG